MSNITAALLLIWGADVLNLPFMEFLDKTYPLNAGFWFGALVFIWILNSVGKGIDNMRYSDILGKFFMLFPDHRNDVVSWIPAGKNAINVKLSDGSGLVFTYTTDQVWTLESSNGYPVRRG